MPMKFQLTQKIKMEHLCLNISIHLTWTFLSAAITGTPLIGKSKEPIPRRGEVSVLPLLINISSLTGRLSVFIL